MDRIEELRVFVAAADLGGFAQAARRLGTSPAQASKLIARLEDRLNCRLLHRTTRTFRSPTAVAPFMPVRALVEEFDQLERSAAYC
jgi:DNA-binding transcriptional LysR family regulator